MVDGLDGETSGTAQQSLNTLRSVCADWALPTISQELDRFGPELDADLALIERALEETPSGDGPVERSARHLTTAGGKRLRPMLVLLTSRMGNGSHEAAREAAIAVELIHGATLLHDDVVDLGETRRGAPAARIVYGNATSIFAGDCLFVHALRRIRSVPVPELVDRMLMVLEEMVLAESTQLARRGRIEADRETYYRIIKGKTASLFGFAAYAGGAAAGVFGEPELVALESFGRDLGVAFQMVDDILDFAGERNLTRKTLYADLREGKVTYPLIVALERDESGELSRALETTVGNGSAEAPREIVDRIINETNALAITKTVAQEYALRAMRKLAEMPPSPARRMIELVTDAVVERDF